MKKKLILHPDSLTVETFATVLETKARGTVVGHGEADTTGPAVTCKLYSCAPWYCPW